MENSRYFLVLNLSFFQFLHEFDPFKILAPFEKIKSFYSYILYLLIITWSIYISKIYVKLSLCYKIVVSPKSRSKPMLLILFKAEVRIWWDGKEHIFIIARNLAVYISKAFSQLLSDLPINFSSALRKKSRIRFAANSLFPISFLLKINSLIELEIFCISFLCGREQ